MNNKSFLIDSNIIIYSIDNTCSWYWFANLIIKSSKINLYISIQNIAEIYRVITNGKKVSNPLLPVDAQTIIIKKVENLKIIYPNERTIMNALNLAVKKGIAGLDFFDCLIAQVVIENKLDGVITHDNNFADKYRNDFSVIDLQESLRYI